jgi:CubicO group peptidase (beta-lactamase class C family)
MDELEVPGVALGVLAGGAVETAVRGVTSIDNPLPVTSETLFQAGSITKTVTATAALRLQEEGLLDLDDPVRKLEPELRLADPDVADRVTLRHLLTHGGGWVGDWFDDFGWGDDVLARAVEVLEQLPQLAPLGELWSYNNAGFYAAGRVLEVAAGVPYEEVVRTRVLEPMGMERSYMFPWEVMTERFAVGHLGSGEEQHVARPWPVPRLTSAAGALVTCVPDLLVYARALMEDATLAPLQEPQLETGTEDEHMGLAWFLKRRRGVLFVEHGGTTLGQQAILSFAPERGFAIAALANHSNGAALITRVSETAFAAYLGVEPWEPPSREAAPEELEEVVGRYELPLGNVELRLEEGKLILEVFSRGGFPKPDSPPQAVPPPAEATLYDADRLVVVEGVMRKMRGQLVRDAEGRIAWLRFGRRVHRRVDPR